MKFDPTIVHTRFTSPLGGMIVAATAHGLAGLWFDDQKHLPDSQTWPTANHHPVLLEAISQLHSYFAGERRTFDFAMLPLDLSGGTIFQQSVWQALLTIAPGSTTSYGQLSASIGNPKAVRAVGSAVGRNPVSIIVPCHRVLGADGSLTGYAGGLARKTALLALEGAPHATQNIRKGSDNMQQPVTATSSFPHAAPIALTAAQRTGNLF